jgi:arsenate reductase (glutaredoxin)
VYRPLPFPVTVAERTPGAPGGGHPPFSYHPRPVAKLTVYEKRTCTTCRRLAEVLEQSGVPFDRVDYHVEPLPADRIRELLRKAGLRPAEALRTKEPLVEELHLLERDDLGDEELIALMAEHPELLQRPIVERGDRAVLARPVEKVLELL